MKKYAACIIALFIFFNSCSGAYDKAYIKESIGTTWSVLIEEGLIESGIVELEKIDIDALALKVREKLIDNNEGRSADLLLGVLFTAGSGLSLGIHESFTFGYLYPRLGSRPLREFLTGRVNSDILFAKSLTSQKLFRTADVYLHISAWNRFQRYFGLETWKSYAAMFLLKNLSATMWRDWAKYGRLFYSFQFELILPL